MRLTSIQYYQWKKEITATYSTYTQHEQRLLHECGIGSNKQFYIRRFINMLCRKGRNTFHYELNNTRFLAILEILKTHIPPSISPVCYLTRAIINGAHYAEPIPTKKGSINVNKKVIFMPNVVINLTLNKVSALARTMTPVAFANELVHAYANDQKSKLIASANDTLKLAKAAVE